MSARCDCGCSDVECGCCAGVETVTPLSTYNRPRLGALTYRVATHGALLESMTARLSSHTLPTPDGPRRPLAALKARTSDDPAIALLDAFAVLGDVLTFYQERIANEGYLRTATELRSLHELARLVGYRPRPGVAASVFLAYTIDPNTKTEVVIPAGARVQSVPGPGESPQTFETGEALRARAAWNVLRPRLTQPHRRASIAARGAIYLRGTSTLVKKGDPLLVTGGGADPLLLRVTNIEVDLEAERTRVSTTPWALAVVEAIGGGIGESLDARGATILKLLDSPPPGVTAERVVSGLQDMRKALATPDATLHPELASAALRVVNEELEGLGAGATRLRPWLSDLRAALDAPTFMVAATKSVEADGDPVAGLVAELSKRPSQPLPNALRLTRSLGESFTPGGDVALQLVGATAPALRESLGTALAAQQVVDGAPLEVHAFRVRTGVFGRNAIKRQRLVRDVSLRTNGSNTDDGLHSEIVGEWPILTFGNADTTTSTMTETEKVVFLEGSQEGVTPGSWIVVDSRGVHQSPKDDAKVRAHSVVEPLVTRVTSTAARVTRAEYGVSGEATEVALRDAWLRIDPTMSGTDSQQRIDLDYQVIRGTAVYAQSERLELTEEPIEAALCGGAAANDPLELDGLYEGLEPGRFVVLRGKRHIGSADSGVDASEALMITRVEHDTRASLPGDRLHTFVWVDKPLSYCYRRDASTLYGNVVKATHGETREETLGSGDGATPSQHVALKQGPLTFVSAASATGVDSTLRVFVNDLGWQERDGFIDCAPSDRVYVTRNDTEGKATVVFGDGIEGARPPTGLGNITATYRMGIGAGGNVRAEQITQLTTRPLGVRDVVNPVRASGGADPESRDDVRRNAPVAVTAFGRLVATRDYADFARTFAGIGKAAATELSDGRRVVVQVTIAGEHDVPIDPSSDLFINLRRALRDLGDPLQPVVLDRYEPLLLIIGARIRIDADARWENVVSNVRAALFDAFSFDRRALGADVTSSAVLGTMQSVRGVSYIDLETFGAIPATVADPSAEDGRRPATPQEIAAAVQGVLAGPVATRVRALPARRDAEVVRAAQLAMLRADVQSTLVLNQIT